MAYTKKRKIELLKEMFGRTITVHDLEDNVFYTGTVYTITTDGWFYIDIGDNDLKSFNIEDEYIEIKQETNI